MRNIISDLEAQLEKMMRLPNHREVAIAITKLQESIMWLKQVK